jgi:hypothetical protein
VAILSFARRCNLVQTVFLGSHTRGVAGRSSVARPVVVLPLRHTQMKLRPNMSIDADPQQQEAASPQVLVVRSFLRYTAHDPRV